MLKGFPPIIAKHPIAMILGSMPSVTSLEKQEYYGFKHNRFWKFLSRYFHEELYDYEDKKKLILAHRLILWDVIGSCEREGSLDSNIRCEEVNDIRGLVRKYPDLRYVICNGKKAYDLYQRHFFDLPLICLSLPSTSNANRTIKEEDLYKKWEAALRQALVKEGE